MDVFKAIRTGDKKAVQAYLQSGGDVNARDSYHMTPLIYAADEKQIEILKLLIHSKADLNAVDKIGQTALMMAAGRNDPGCVKLLIDAKANLNLIAKNGLTAYGYARENGNTETALLLKKFGAK